MLVLLSIVSVLGADLTRARQIDVIEGKLNKVHGRQKRAVDPAPVTEEFKELYLSLINSVRSSKGSSSMNQLVI